MAMDVLEAAKLSQDMFLIGVVETIVKESPILQKLPFIDIVGNGLTYNQEKTLGTIDFYDVGDTWTESTPTFQERTAKLRIMGGDADVDNFLKATRSNLQDLEQAVTELKAKALRHKFEETFVYGNATTNPNQFDGIRALIDTATAGDQVVMVAAGVAGGAGGTLALNDLDKLQDAVKGEVPDMFLMSRRSRRKINALIRAAGGYAAPSKDELGNWVQRWNEIPIYISDWILDTHTVAAQVEGIVTGQTNSVIYALKFGEGALCGLQTPDGIQAEIVGKLETKDANRTRIKWYPGLALFNSLKAAALIGVQE